MQKVGFDRDEWSERVELDEDVYVTEYATTNYREDYAESLVAWVLLRGYPDQLAEPAKENIRRIPNRLAYFDEELHDAMQTAYGHLPVATEEEPTDSAMRWFWWFVAIGQSYERSLEREIES